MSPQDYEMRDSAFYDGLREGVRRYAWWTQGVQHVGSCGTTLEEALQAIDAEQARPSTTEETEQT